MALQVVFSDNLDPENGSLTARFTNATAFYIDAPLLEAELEIDAYLQVYFPTATGERLRNLPLGKLKDGEIKLNEIDSISVETIGLELIDSGLEMAIYFTSSDTTFLEVYVLGLECTLCGIKSQVTQLDDKITALSSKVDELATANSSNQSALTALLNLILTAVGLPVPALPATSAQQEFFFLQ